MHQQFLSTPFVVRGAVVTASVSLTTGTNTTLISGDSDYLLDLVQIGFSNDSAATTLVLRDDGTTIRTFAVPISTSQSPEYSFPVPIPQNKKGGIWQVDLPDITGTTVVVNALFIKRDR